MNILLEKGHISEMKCGSNFAYNLNDNGIFLPTQYKVLQSQNDTCFVKCTKMLYNGKIQVYYIVNALKPLSAMLGALDPDSFVTITFNLFTDIIDVKHNGFLSCENIDIAFDKIYVDPSTLRVQLVYLPTSARFFGDYASFESELRTSFIKVISGISSLTSPRTIQLAADLSNGMLSLEDLCDRTKGRNIHSTSGAPINQDVSVRIVAMNAPTRVELVVNKDSYVIGKNAAAVDGAVLFNKLISRIHCCINKNGRNVSITDLHSANGTYVNNIRLQPDQTVPLKNGDVIRLADSSFQICIG